METTPGFVHHSGARISCVIPVPADVVVRATEKILADTQQLDVRVEKLIFHEKISPLSGDRYCVTTLCLWYSAHDDRWKPVQSFAWYDAAGEIDWELTEN